MATKKQKRDWIDCTQASVAECLGVSVNTVALWASKGMPGSKGRYRVPDIVAWLLSSGPWSKHQHLDEETALLSGGDSPGLERLRLAKAELAELDLAHRKGLLQETEQVKKVLGRLAQLLRRFGERLGKRFGNDAAISLNETMSEFESTVCDELESSTSDGPD